MYTVIKIVLSIMSFQSIFMATEVLNRYFFNQKSIFLTKFVHMQS